MVFLAGGNLCWFAADYLLNRRHFYWLGADCFLYQWVFFQLVVDFSRAPVLGRIFLDSSATFPSSEVTFHGSADNFPLPPIDKSDELEKVDD